MASPHSYRWSIATDENGEDYWTFKVNPVDVKDLWTPRAYTAIDVLEGNPLLQFPIADTQLRSVRFDPVTDSNTTRKEFVIGATESDTESLLYLQKLDSDGQLPTYWLNIPTADLRPVGWRVVEWIPIRVERVDVVPTRYRAGVQWQATMYFRLMPLYEAGYAFKVDFSPLDSVHALISDHLGAVYTFDASSSSYTDRTTEAYTGGTPFPTFTVVAGDMLYFGCVTEFYGVWFDIDTAETVAPDAEQGATEHAWQYWDGTTWSAVTAVDTTEAFTKDERTVSWEELSSWAQADLSVAVSGAPSTSAMYWVRCVIGTVTTAFDFNKILRA